jgi:hypothetical protein
MKTQGKKTNNDAEQENDNTYDTGQENDNIHDTGQEKDNTQAKGQEKDNTQNNDMYINADLSVDTMLLNDSSMSQAEGDSLTFQDVPLSPEYAQVFKPLTSDTFLLDQTEPDCEIFQDVPLSPGYANCQQTSTPENRGATNQQQQPKFDPPVFEDVTPAPPLPPRLPAQCRRPLPQTPLRRSERIVQAAKQDKK